MEWGLLLRTLLAAGVAVALVIPLTRWEVRSTGPKRRAACQSVCPVLVEDHVHEDGLLKGTWNGRHFKASAYQVDLGQYGGSSRSYRVAMPAEHDGPAWRLTPDGVGIGGTRRAWALRTDRLAAETQLVDAGLVAAVHEIEWGAVHLRPGASLSYDPRTGEVVYEDQSGEVPCRDDFPVHLDLVSRAVAISAAAAVAAGERVEREAEGPVGLHLRAGSPPPWVLGLWFPAALTVLASVHRWPWSFMLLPLALAAPLVGRVRIGRP